MQSGKKRRDHKNGNKMRNEMIGKSVLEFLSSREYL